MKAGLGSRLSRLETVARRSRAGTYLSKAERDARLEASVAEMVATFGTMGAAAEHFTQGADARAAGVWASFARDHADRSEAA